VTLLDVSSEITVSIEIGMAIADHHVEAIPMLRITRHDAGAECLLELEGCLAGPWVTEVALCWIGAATSQPGRRICVDFSDVCHVDGAARELMSLMYRAGVRFVATGLVIPEIVREISAAVDRERRS
jgi:hypothetical protein